MVVKQIRILKTSKLLALRIEKLILIKKGKQKVKLLLTILVNSMMN